MATVGLSALADIFNSWLLYQERSTQKSQTLDARKFFLSKFPFRSSLLVLVRSRIRTIIVHIHAAREPAMPKVRLDLAFGNTVPFIRHNLCHAAKRQRAMTPN